MLIFFSNELQAHAARDKLKLPITFVSFAHVVGKLYTHFRSNSTFLLLDKNRTWGNSVVYGSIWHISDWTFYSRLLDAYHSCSLSSIGVNHKFDIHHRISVSATPIHFDNLDDFSRLKYREVEQNVSVQLYVGNPKHPKITQRIRRNLTHSYRITDGVDATSFVKSFGEVANERD